MHIGLGLSVCDPNPIPDGGVLGVTLADVTLVATGQVKVHGTLAATSDDATLVATGTVSAAVFDPATLSPDGWWRHFAGAPWTPTAPSAHGNLVTSGTAPTVGTAVNGYTPASFDGLGATLVSAQASSNFVALTAMTIVVLFKASALVADQSAWYSERPLVAGDGGDFGFSNSASGVRSGNGIGGNTPYVSLAAGVWAMCALRVTGTTIKIRVSQASGTVDMTPTTIIALNLDSTLKMGGNWNATVFQVGDFLEVLTWKSVLADADLVNMKSYFNSHYGLSLT